MLSYSLYRLFNSYKFLFKKLIILLLYFSKMCILEPKISTNSKQDGKHFLLLFSGLYIEKDQMQVGMSFYLVYQRTIECLRLLHFSRLPFS